MKEVAEVYRLAYELGCKGTTIYRDGSRDEQVLNIGKVNDGKAEAPAPGEKPLPDHVEQVLAADCDSTACVLRNGSILPRPRPDVTMGYTEKVKIGCGKLFITVNYDEQGICEVFTNTGRAGGCPSQSEATARLVSIALRSGVDSDEIITQLKGIRCPSCLRQSDVPVTSCPDAIAKAIEKVMKASKGNQLPPCPPPTAAAPGTRAAAKRVPPMGPRGNLDPDMTPAEAKLAKFCPECGAPLEHEGGCVTCRDCGYSKCG